MRSLHGVSLGVALAVVAVSTVASAAGAAPLTIPDPPTAVTATAGNGSAVVSWTAPDSDGGSTILRYTVVASPGPAQCEAPAVLPCTVAGLTNGIAYTFTVIASNALGDSLASAPSVPVTPVAASSTLTLRASRATLVYGGSVRLSGTLADAVGGVAHQILTVQSSRPASTTWTTAGRTTTLVTGAYAVTLKPTANVRYRLSFGGITADIGARSPEVAVAVAPAVSWTLRASIKKHRAALVIRGAARPVRSHHVVRLQRLGAKGWATVASGRLSAHGTYALRTKVSGRGSSRWRVVVPGDANYATGHGATRTLKIR